MGYHNRDHRERRVISKHKLLRVYTSNLGKAGVAYRRVKGETQTSSVACKVGPIIYALFTKERNESLKEDICIRYLEDEKDQIAFSDYKDPFLARLDLIKMNHKKYFDMVKNNPSKFIEVF